MADPSESTTHGLYLSGNFEIDKKTSPENGWRSEYRTYSVCIGAGGAHRERRMSYEIQLKGFSPAQFKLEEGSIYYLRGSFFPTNTDQTKDDVMFFEASDRIKIGPAIAFEGDLVNSIGVTGVGIVTAITQMPEPRTTNLKPNPADGEKIVTVVTVLHSDYHPTLKEAKQCKVQYRVPPARNLAGIPKILQVGREYQFHGFLKDFDEDNLVYVVIASKVTPTTGSKEYDVGTSPKAVKENNQTSAGSSKKPMKFVPKAPNAPFKSPLIVTDSESSSNRLSGESNFSRSSISSASSDPTAGPPHSPSDNSVCNEIPALPAKRQSRAQPKRVTKKPKALDLTLPE